MKAFRNFGWGKAAGALALGFATLWGTSARAALLYYPIVTVIGDGTTTTDGTGVATSVSMYMHTIPNQASAVSSATYNNTGSTADTRLVNSNLSSSEGMLSNNPGVSDAAAKGQAYGGTYYAFNGGYDAVAGTVAVNGTNAPSPAADRTVGSVTLGVGSVSSPAILAHQPNATTFKGDNIRGATGTDNLSTVYASGNDKNVGWWNMTAGTTLSNVEKNARTIELLGGTLFGTSNKNTIGLYNATTGALIIGTGAASDPYEFALFNDPNNPNSTSGYNVAYIADGGGGTTTASGGIEKWTYNGASWNLDYILQDTATTYYRGLAGQVDPATGKVTLFATTSDSMKLEQVTDNGSAASSPFTVLATAGANYSFQGVALAPVPEPSTMVLAGLGMVGLFVLRLRRKSRA